ncbi:MAG TPA: hypothetical protein PLM22_00625 [Candidatus Sabulitectum sp.]|nr:hypothetical protein [Candidatus Sabulitectum sp.]HPF32247.1 hypothetical protein [Candidatus Sabulitectum sp.]HPJ27403.1 hypothetical protein [Candidatus Sabulitectum sp.]HPR22750.1 hypothetical protein [Candidatus Sabulitectum sp.]HRW77236.1 hypothetical protein [Candidatus Sabulitectum sp.]
MKTMLLMIMGLILTAGCGGEQPPAENGSEPAEDTAEGTVEDTVEETVEEVPEVVLYPEGTLDPSTLQDGDLVSATALSQAFFAWDGMEITLVAYPYIWYGDSTEVEDELRLVLDPESTDEVAVANFEGMSGQVVHRGELVALRGTVESGWWGPELNDAEFVDPPESMEWVETSPWAYQGEAIPADQFVELYNALTGKEIVVEGYYSSTTTSTLDSGVIIRVDLSDPEDTYDKLVACEMTGEIPEDVNAAMVENRAGVQIRGTIAGESFRMVGLENCTVVNR